MDDATELTGRLLFDSNVWIQEVGLMSRRASTLRLYMLERGKRLIVPEVVQAEVAHHLSDRMRTSAAAGRKAHEQLVRMLGTLAEWRIPSDEEVAQHADRLARGKDVPADYVELQADTALRGAKRCPARRPPAHRATERAGRGFADCLIWEEVLNVLDGHDLCFVTNDGDFFDDDGSDKLHGILKEEAEGMAHALQIERGLDAILKEFRTQFSIDTEVLLNCVSSRGAVIRATAESIGFEAKGPPEVRYEAYATENAREVEVRFTSVQPFADTSERGWRTDGLRIEGKGIYETKTGRLEDVSMDLERLTYVDGEGNQKSVPGSTVYARLDPLYLGTRPIASDRRELIGSR